MGKTALFQVHTSTGRLMCSLKALCCDVPIHDGHPHVQGGLALGEAVKSSGLLDNIATTVSALVTGWSVWPVLAVFSALVLVFTTVISHTVSKTCRRVAAIMHSFQKCCWKLRCTQQFGDAALIEDMTMAPSLPPATEGQRLRSRSTPRDAALVIGTLSPLPGWRDDHPASGPVYRRANSGE